MDLFKQKKSVDELEEEGTRLSIQSENVSREAEIAEKQAIVRGLKKKYGSDWRSKLGLRGKIDLDTLRSFLSSASKGLKGQGGALYNPNLSPLPRRRE